jgi:hypothetical protein
MVAEIVTVPEWGGNVRVRALTGKERDTFEQMSIKRGAKGEIEVNMVNMRARLVSLCVVDEKGERIFTDADVARLGRKSASALERVAKVAQRLSGIGEEAKEKAAEDFFADQGDDSITD